MTGRAVTDTGPAGAGLLYDTRRGVHYPKPVPSRLAVPAPRLGIAGRQRCRWPDPYPSVFGYHEVFHVYVCAAAACQFAAIALVVG